MSKYPNVRVDLSDMARRMQQGEIQQGSFDGPAKGMEAVGQAVGQAGNVFQALGERMAQSKNQADLSRAEGIMSQARVAHAQEMQSLPEDQWVPTWEQKYRPMVEQQLDALHLSPWARERVVPQLVQFDATTRSGLAYDALKQTASRDRQSMMDGLKLGLESRDYGAARRNVQRLLDSHQITPEHGQLMEQEIDSTVLRDGIGDATQQHPRAVMDDMAKAMRDGKSEMFPDLSHQPELIRRSYEQARRLTNEREQSAYGQALNDFAQGVPMDQIHDRYDSDLSEHRRAILDKEIANDRPYDAAVDGPTIASLRADIAKYDGHDDATLQGMYGLLDRITSLPRDSRGPLRSLLSQSWQATAAEKKPKNLQQSLRAEYLGEIVRLGRSGALGDTGIRDVTLPLHYAKAAALGVQIVQRQDELEKWAAGNTTASRKEWRDKFQEIVGPDAAAQAAREFAPAWLRPADDEPTASVDDATMRFVQQIEGFTPQAHWDYHQLSVGYGTRAHAAGEQLDEPTAAVRLRAELSHHAANVDRAGAKAGIAFTPNQRAALISFDFNTGKASEVIKETLGDPEGIADRLSHYTYAGSRKQRGLADRRQQEIELFQTR